MVVAQQQPPCVFLRLANAQAALWQGEAPVFQTIPRAEFLSRGGRPLLFVHGIEYADPEQVVSDLIIPFEREAQFFQRGSTANWQVYLVSWDSRLAISEALRQRMTVSMTSAVLHFATKVHLFPRHLKKLERRARRIAHYVHPFIHQLFRHADESPVVVSHSLGSYLWAEVVDLMVRKDWHHVSWGTWLNMQPAICHKAYAQGGALSRVLEAYDGVRGVQHLWYSSRDLVLATLYRLGKRSFAMGQVGAGDAPIIQRDLTRLAQEAHGLARLHGRRGSFFQRVSSILHMEAELIMGNHSVAFYY